MKLTFLGSGSAFTVGGGNYHSNILIEHPSGKKLLIDCGTDARLSFHDIGLCYRDVTDVYISHLHADHCGGLEWLGYETKFDANCPKPNLYMSDMLLEELWTKLAPGLSSLQGVITDLSTFFNVHPIKKNCGFEWESIHFRLVQTIHAVSGFVLMPSFGLLFTLGNSKIFFTSDTQFLFNQIKDFYEMADVIFQDCETAPHKSGVHARYEELCTLDKNIKAKMWLYHYNAGPLPDAIKDGFKGFIKRGQSFNF